MPRIHPPCRHALPTSTTYLVGNRMQNLAYAHTYARRAHAIAQHHAPRSTASLVVHDIDDAFRY
jgi:hypothetical protein